MTKPSNKKTKTLLQIKYSLSLEKYDNWAPDNKAYANHRLLDFFLAV